MNEIAAKLGEVGLPAPIKELAAKRWDVVVVGGGHNGLTAAAYLARAGQSVLVLERRERLGGACTLERPFPDQRYSVSPCAYVVGLLDELVIKELGLRQRGFECYVADPNLWVPFEDGTSFGQWLDDAKTQRNLEELKVSKHDIEGYWAYEHLFDEIRRGCAHAAATPGSARARPARRSRISCTASRRCSTSSSKRRSPTSSTTTCPTSGSRTRCSARA